MRQVNYASGESGENVKLRATSEILEAPVNACLLKYERHCNALGLYFTSKLSDRLKPQQFGRRQDNGSEDEDVSANG